MPRLTPDVLDPRNNLQYYTKDALKNSDIWTPREMRREYARLRDIAQKRLKRLAVAEPESYAYRMNKGAYAPTRTLSDREVQQLLPQLAKFIAAKTGTVSGIRSQQAKAVAKLHSHGYMGITTTNYKQFSEFMEQWHADKKSHFVGSPPVVEFFEFTQKQEIPWEVIKEDFAHWLRQRKNLEKYVAKLESKNKQVTSDMIITEFDRLEKQREARNARRRAKRAAGGQ